MLIVVASMKQELAGLRRQLKRGGRPKGVDGPPGAAGTSPWELRVVGMGRQAGAALRSILAPGYGLSGLGLQPPIGLLMLGLAGAVDPGLETGDLVLSARYYRQPSNDTFPSIPLKENAPGSGNQGGFPPAAQGGLETQGDYLVPDPRLWQWATAASGNLDRPVVYADSLTVGGLVTTPRDKQAVKRLYPVGIVNMEDYWAAAAALEAGVPFISVRAVLDPARQSLPAYLPGMSGSPGKALSALAAAPWRAPALAGLWRQLGIAQLTLTGFALNFLAQAADAAPALARQDAVGTLPTPGRSVPV